MPRVVGEEFGEAVHRILIASSFGLGPAHVEKRARTQLLGDFLHAQVGVALRSVVVVAFVEEIVGTDQAREAEEFMIAMRGRVARDEARGELREVLVIEQVEAIQLPVAGLEGFLRVRMVLLDEQVHLHRAGVAFAQPEGMSDDQSHLRQRVAGRHHFRVAVVEVDHAIVIAFGMHGLDHADQGDAAAAFTELREAEGLLKHRHRIVMLADLRVNDTGTQRGIGDDAVVFAVVRQFEEGFEGLLLLILGKLHVGEREQRGLAIRIVLRDGDKRVQRVDVALRVTEQLEATAFVVQRGQFGLRAFGARFAEGEKARRGLQPRFGTSFVAIVDLVLRVVEGDRAEAVGGGGRALAGGVTVHHFFPIRGRLLQHALLAVAFADAEERVGHAAAVRVLLQILRVILRGELPLLTLVSERGKVELIIPGAAGEAGLHRQRLGRRCAIFHRQRTRRRLGEQSGRHRAEQERDEAARDGGHKKHADEGKTEAGERLFRRRRGRRGALGVRLARGEGDVVDAGLLARVHHADDVLVIGDLIAADDDGLLVVPGHLDDVVQLREELVHVVVLAVDDDLTLFFDVDDDLTDRAGLLVLAGVRRGHAHIHRLLILGVLEGHGEENDQQEQHIDQRRELHGRGFDAVLFAEVHRRWIGGIRTARRRGQRVCIARRAAPSGAWSRPPSPR